MTGKGAAKCWLLAIVFFVSSLCMHSQILHVGQGQPFASIEIAAQNAVPGDTILVHGGIYPGGMTIDELKGTPDQWITILTVSGDQVIVQGGNNSIQFRDPAYVEINGLILQGQTGNGMNIDDAGNYLTPAHHVIIRNCVFRDISVNGNNDLLKLSGLDDFLIEDCVVENGADGGSGIDMVGCHRGLIRSTRFENLGASGIQAKGGTDYIRIESNTFFDAGLRALNLGGSTGLQFFRPDTAHYEAGFLQVYSNIFYGAWAPIAYVGSIGVDVANNTIIAPANWVVRILQETVDTSRFFSCGDNYFRNNVIFQGDIGTTINIGPNTRPESFTFSHNLWYNFNNVNWSGPNIPVDDPEMILNENPLFENLASMDLRLKPGSPAIGTGMEIPDLSFDFFGLPFASPPSRGAIESAVTTGILQPENPGALIYPNPSNGQFSVEIPGFLGINPIIEVFDIIGRSIDASIKKMPAENKWMITLSGQIPGLYTIRIDNPGQNGSHFKANTLIIQN